VGAVPDQHRISSPAFSARDRTGGRGVNRASWPGEEVELKERRERGA